MSIMITCKTKVSLPVH